MTTAPAPVLTRQPTPAPVLRRCGCGRSSAGGECAECRAKRLRRSPSTAVSMDAAPGVVHDALRSPGQPLDAQTRAFMEPRFGHSFASVRVHADHRAAQSAAAVGARAYAVGHDVVFGSGTFAPSSTEGRKLIAHELAHVVQQSGSTSTLAPSLEIGPVDAPEEREADAAANAVVSSPTPDGGPASALGVRAASTPSVLRRDPQPTARQVRRDEQLRNMARWPGEGLTGWRGLSEAERTVVVLYMTLRYGDDFAAAFLAVASNPRQRRRSPVTHFTNVLDETHDQIRARGYRLNMVSGNVEYWVRPNGDELRRILPSQRATTEPAGEQAPPPPPQNQPPEPEQSPARLPDRSTWGPPVRNRPDARVMGTSGRAVQYRDGTIELDQGGGRTITYRPRPNSTGAYDFYGEDHVLVENVILFLDPAEIFGGAGGTP
jgi:hypothetical protein